MKEIKAIVQPFMLEGVIDALAAVEDLPGVTISEVIGWGKNRAVDMDEPVRRAGHAFARKSKVEVVVSNEMAERVVETIVLAARTGKPGDGKVFSHDLAGAVRIRTGDRGLSAV